MKQENTNNILICTAIIYGLVGLQVIKGGFPDAYTPLMWIVPSFFYIYEGAFAILVNRFKRMKPQGVVTAMMIMRGVKFLVVAAMMLIWVKAGLVGKQHFLIYVLGFYLITSGCEALVVSAYNKSVQTKQEK